MKRNILLLLLLAPAVLASAQNKWNSTPYLTKSLKGETVKEAFVNTSGGSISVTGIAAGEEARVEVYVSPGNDNEDITKDELTKRLTDNYDLNVTVNGGEVHASAKSKKSIQFWNKSLSISFKVFVPQQCATTLNTSGGSIHLANLKGSQDFTTSGGSLHVDGLSGIIKGRTSGGSITANNCDGTISLSTSGGSVNLTSLKGATHATTSGGSIRGNHCEGELITSTSGGSINLTELACTLDASTSGGSVHVQLNTLGKYVKIGNSGGHIDLQIPAKQGADLNLHGNRVNANMPDGFSGTKERDYIQGKLNGGGVPVDVHSGSSNLNLSFN